MERLRKTSMRTGLLVFLSLLVVFALWRPTAESQDEALSISCFFCHMEIIAEMKAHAVKHWEADTKCEACHGQSIEHLDVEDNSIKPDKVWNETTVHGLCKECHKAAFEGYVSSAHARLAMNPNRGAQKGPNCSSCHGYHGLKSASEIRGKCLSCHPSLPTVCTSRTGATGEQEFPCRRCHDSHSLVSVKSH